MKNLVLTGMLGFFLVGCATTGDYQNYASPDAACVTGDTANFFKFYTSGEAHVLVKAVDGVPTGRGGADYCFTAGKHKLHISAAMLGYRIEGPIEYEFAARKKYQLRANKSGAKVEVQLYDVTQETANKLQVFELMLKDADFVPFIPVIVPAKR